MSDNMEAISAEEAGRALAQARRDREQEGFGIKGVEAGMGYTDMTPAIPIDAPSDLEITSQELGAELLKDREEQPGERPVDIVRQYNYHGGSKDGQKMPDNEVVQIEQASSDLSHARHQEAEALWQAENQALADEINSLIGQQQPVEPQQAQQQSQQPQAPTEPVALDQQIAAQQETPQPVQQQTPQAQDPVVKALQENPALLAAVNQEITRHYAVAQQTQAAYVAATRQNAEAALAHCFNDVPEIAGCKTSEEINVVLRSLGEVNPSRRREIMDKFNRVQSFVQEAQRAQALQQQEWARHQQQELANDQYNRARWVEAEDNRYEEWAAQNSTPEERIAIQQEALNIIRESGAKDEDIAAEWHSGRSPLRSSWAQKALHDAARWRLAQKSIASKVARPVPTVQRPGAGGERATATEYQFKTLSEKIGRTSGREQLKAAAEYVSARRNARR